MTKQQVESVAFAIWKTDYPLLKLPDWIVYPEWLKKLYYKQAKDAIKAYKECLKEGL